MGREESGVGGGLHGDIPEGSRRQEDDRPRERQGGDTAGLPEHRRRRRLQARIQARRELPATHAAQARQEEVGILRRVLIFWLLLLFFRMRRIAIIHNCRTRSIPDGSKSKIGEEGGGGCFCDHGVRSLHVYLTMFHMNTLPICIEKGAETKLIADSV